MPSYSTIKGTNNWTKRRKRSGEECGSCTQLLSSEVFNIGRQIDSMSDDPTVLWTGPALKKKKKWCLIFDIKTNDVHFKQIQSLKLTTKTRITQSFFLFWLGRCPNHFIVSKSNLSRIPKSRAFLTHGSLCFSFQFDWYFKGNTDYFYSAGYEQFLKNAACWAKQGMVQQPSCPQFVIATKDPRWQKQDYLVAVSLFRRISFWSLSLQVCWLQWQVRNNVCQYNFVSLLL